MEINCDDCVMQHTSACDDCVVSFIVGREPGESVPAIDRFFDLQLH